jgi:benzoate-CoA ligase family protein
MRPFEDKVPHDAPGSREIGFAIPGRYNAGRLLFDNLERGLADKTAVYSTAGNWTYGELCRRSAQVGNALLGAGLQRGDRVLLFLNDHPSYVTAFFGAVRAGLVPLLINTLSPADLLHFYLEDSGARAAIFDAEYAALFSEETTRDLPELKVLVAVNGAAQVSSRVPLQDERWFDAQSAELAEADTHRDEMAFWLYSSGSTGRPKGVVHLQHDPAYIAKSYGEQVLGIARDDICFSVPKIFFAYGFGNSIVFPFSVGAASVLHGGRPEPAAVFDTVRRFRPTLLFGLPTLYTALSNHPAAESADLSSVRQCISAAEILSGEVFSAWKRRFGLEIMEGLGSTEVLHIYLSNRPQLKKLGAAGVRVPGYEIRLTDIDGNDVPPGEEGVMWVRGDSNAPSYWNRPDKTADTMREGWIWTGDRFQADADGFYFFRGRADDLIKVSGQWVYPMEVELCLNEHPAVRESAVLGLPLPDQRMTLKAFVALRQGQRPGPALNKELRDYVKGQLLPYKYPRIIEYLEELPKTGTGKIDRVLLKNRPLEPDAK